MDIARIFSRIQAILLRPKEEWPVIASEPATAGGIFAGWVVPLALVPAVFSFLQLTVLGLPLVGSLGFGFGLLSALAGYALTLLSVFVVAKIVDALAPSFGAQKDPVQAMKATAYAYTASFVAGVGAIVPFLGVLIALAGAVYGIYLLHLGLKACMKAPEDKAVGYTAVVVVIAIVLSAVASFAIGGLTARATLGSLGDLPRSGAVGREIEEAARKGEQAARSMEESAARAAEAAAAVAAVAAAPGNAAAGESAAVAVEALSTEKLREFVPETLGGLPRTSIRSERNSMGGVQIAEAEAQYSDGAGRELRLKISDLGTLSSIAVLGMMMETERETDDELERARRVGDRFLREQWNRRENAGEYSVMLAKRYMVTVEGNAASLDALRAAAESVDLARLEATR